MSGQVDCAAERARLRAARVEIGGRLVAVNAQRHGTRRTYDVHGCQCDPCRVWNATRKRALRADRRTRTPRVVRKGVRVKPSPIPRPCALDGCDELVVVRDGETPSMYVRRRYHDEQCASRGRSATLRTERQPRQCPGCPAVFVPSRAEQKYHEKACQMAELNRPRSTAPRETKTCECGCDRVFERPVGIGSTEWGNRRFLDAEHRRRGDRAEGRSPLATRGEDGAEPGAARAGGRSAPRPVPSRDRKTPQEDRRAISPPIRFAQTPIVKRIVPVEKTTRPRPSFGLSRRSA